MINRQRGSVAIIFLVILLLLSLSVAWVGFMLLQKEKALKAEVEERLRDTELKFNISEKNLQKAKEEVDEVKTKLQASEDQLKNLQEELKAEVEAREKSVAEVVQIKQELEGQKQLKEELERQLSNAKAEVDRITSQNKELEKSKAELNARLSKQEVELGKIVVNPEAPSDLIIVSSPEQEKAQTTAPDANTPSTPAANPQVPAPENAKVNAPVAAPENLPAPTPANVPAPAPENPPAAPPAAAPVAPPQASPQANEALSGKVIVVNKEYNFVVIDLGRKSGINTGDIFTVLRDNKKLGEVKVEKVHEAMSAANMVSANMKDNVKEGDQVQRNK